MAGEIQFDGGATGLTTYAILRNSIAQVYNLTTALFETFTSGNYSGSYPISGSEQGVTGYYVANFPSGVIPGYYNLVAKQQGSVFPVQTDVSLANGNLWWTGSGVQTFPNNFNDLSITTAGLVTPVSGAFATVTPSSLSGVVVNSGLFVTVPIATISGAVANSGLFVTVPIATISGAVGNSGQFVNVPISTLSGVQPISGTFVSVPISSISGVNAIVNNASLSGTTVNANVTLWQGVPPNALIASGRLDAAFNLGTVVAASGTANTIQFPNGAVPLGISGTLDNQVITIVAGIGSGRSRTIQNMGSSGIATIFPPWDASGVAGSGSVFTITPGSQTASGQLTMASGITFIGTVLSGQVWIASGTAASLSGVFANVPPSTLSGVVANSGLFVTASVSIASGALSGQQVTLVSGQSYTASGIFVTAIATITSGQVYLASGTNVLVYSGQLSGQQVTLSSGSQAIISSGGISLTSFASGILGVSGGIATAWGNSGAVVVAINLDKSGYTIGALTSGILSGQQVTLTSGQSYTASGIFATATATIASGALSGQLVTLVSGQSYIASGINTIVPPSTLSGVVVNSGLFVSVPIATISGAIGNSGQFVSVLPATLSGVVANSGQFVTVPISTISGVQPISGTTVSVPIASISGVNAVTTIASGTTFLASGQSVLVYSGQLSGQPIAPNSGQIYLNSGYVLANSGLFYVASGSVNAIVPSGSISLPSGSVVATVNSGAVWLASGQAAYLYSGQFVNVYSGQLSGQPMTLASGLSTVYFTSGAITLATFASGVLGVSGGFATAWGNSGAVVVAVNLDKSGYTIGALTSGILSGQQVTLTSGQSYTASGIFVNATATVGSGLFVTVPIASISGNFSVVPPSTLSGVIANSGLFVTVPVATISGIYPASGSLSGQPTSANSGLFVTVPIASISGTNVVASVTAISSGLLSGQQVTLTSGQSYTASGIFVNAASVTVGSGLFVTVPISSISGTRVLVPPATLSGVVANSGLFVNATAVIPSGTLYLNSGWPQQLLIYDASGVPNSPVHTMVNAHRKLINKWDLTTSSGFLTVFLEDASSVAYTQPLTSQSGAAPVVSLGDA